MKVEQMVKELDSQIQRLTAARDALAAILNFATGRAHSRRQGRHVLSAEARAKIAKAQRERWARAKRLSKKAA